MKLFCIISANSNLETIAWGPFSSLSTSKQVKKRLNKAFPAATHLILPFQNVEDIPKSREDAIDGR